MGKSMELYDACLKKRFTGLDLLSKDELSFLLAVHAKKVDYFKEERKMHFLAFMLVTILFFVVLPQSLAGQYRFEFMLLEGSFSSSWCPTSSITRGMRTG